MDVLINAWANVQYMVYQWFANWYAQVDGAVQHIKNLGYW